MERRRNKKNLRPGEEHGSARWGTVEDSAPLMAPRFEDNIILTQNERLRMIGRSEDPEADRNKNVLIIGGSGSGKTRFFVKPNLMQMLGSYICTDPKGTLVLETGKMFQRGVPKKNPKGEYVRDKNGKIVYEPYKIKVFNTLNFEKSMHYNPFAYFRKEEDIQTFAHMLITNTKEPGTSSGDDFWVQAEQLLYVALISYIWMEAPVEEQNIGMMIDLIDASEVKEDDEDFKNAVDLLFEDLEQTNPDHFAVKEYKKYKLAAGKTAKSILISCGARLAPFDIPRIREMFSYDEMELDRIGEERTILYVILSDMDGTFNFLASIMYTQLFMMLAEKAEQYDGFLPIPVCFMLDEFSNIGQIPDFDKKLAVIRSRNISANVILQSKSQLKPLYKEKADDIVANCDSYLYLGAGGNETIKEVVEKLGKQTIDMQSQNKSKGASDSYGTNDSKSGRDLLDFFEVSTMKRSNCLLFITSTKPFKSPKYDITKHKNYKLLSDYDKKNRFDLVSYIRNYKMPKLNENTEVLVVNGD